MGCLEVISSQLQEMQSEPDGYSPLEVAELSSENTSMSSCWDSSAYQKVKQVESALVPEKTGLSSSVGISFEAQLARMENPLEAKGPLLLWLEARSSNDEMPIGMAGAAALRLVKKVPASVPPPSPQGLAVLFLGAVLLNKLTGLTATPAPQIALSAHSPDLPSAAEATRKEVEDLIIWLNIYRDDLDDAASQFEQAIGAAYRRLGDSERQAGNVAKKQIYASSAGAPSTKRVYTHSRTKPLSAEERKRRAEDAELQRQLNKGDDRDYIPLTLPAQITQLQGLTDMDRSSIAAERKREREAAQKGRKSELREIRRLIKEMEFNAVEHQRLLVQKRELFVCILDIRSGLKRILEDQGLLANERIVRITPLMEAFSTLLKHSLGTGARQAPDEPEVRTDLTAEEKEKGSSAHQKTPQEILNEKIRAEAEPYVSWAEAQLRSPQRLVDKPELTLVDKADKDDEIDVDEEGEAIDVGEEVDDAFEEEPIVPSSPQSLQPPPLPALGRLQTQVLKRPLQEQLDALNKIRPRYQAALEDPGLDQGLQDAWQRCFDWIDWHIDFLTIYCLPYENGQSRRLVPPLITEASRERIASLSRDQQVEAWQQLDAQYQAALATYPEFSEDEEGRIAFVLPDRRSHQLSAEDQSFYLPLVSQRQILMTARVEIQGYIVEARQPLPHPQLLSNPSDIETLGKTSDEKIAYWSRLVEQYGSALEKYPSGWVVNDSGSYYWRWKGDNGKTQTKRLSDSEAKQMQERSRTRLDLTKRQEKAKWELAELKWAVQFNIETANGLSQSLGAMKAALPQDPKQRLNAVKKMLTEYMLMATYYPSRAGFHKRGKKSVWIVWFEQATGIWTSQNTFSDLSEDQISRYQKWVEIGACLRAICQWLQAEESILSRYTHLMYGMKAPELPNYPAHLILETGVKLEETIKAYKTVIGEFPQGYVCSQGQGRWSLVYQDEAQEIKVDHVGYYKQMVDKRRKLEVALIKLERWHDLFKLEQSVTGFRELSAQALPDNAGALSRMLTTVPSEQQLAFLLALRSRCNQARQRYPREISRATDGKWHIIWHQAPGSHWSPETKMALTEEELAFLKHLQRQGGKLGKILRSINERIEKLAN